MAVCKYHPDRAGVGVCMRCRAVICADCRTRVDGINHCHACLRALGRSPERQSRVRLPEAVTALLFLVVAGVLFFGLFWQVQGQLTP